MRVKISVKKKRHRKNSTTFTPPLNAEEIDEKNVPHLKKGDRSL